MLAENRVLRVALHLEEFNILHSNSALLQQEASFISIDTYIIGTDVLRDSRS